VRRPPFRTPYVFFTILAVAAIGGVVALLVVGSVRGSDRPPDPGAIMSGSLTVGVQDDRLPVAPGAQLDGRMDRLAATGVRVTRVDVLWNQVAPTRPARAADPNDPAYRFGRYDRIVDGLARRGVAVMFDVYRSPTWANGGRGVEWAPDLEDYEAFMSALATRYDGHTVDADGRPHARVGLFEPWNEPNLRWFLQPQWEGPRGAEVPASPRIYAELLRRAYRSIKRAQPTADVIGVSGGPLGRSTPGGGVGIMDFVRDLAGRRPPLDAYSQHLYPALGPDHATAIPSYRSLPTLLQALDRLRPGAPLLITEFGYTTSPSPYRTRFVSESEQALFLPRALELLAAEPRVRLAMWFNLQDNAGWPSGLLREDGTAKPSWTEMAELPKRVTPTTRG
jgi:hypothetical protein